MAIEKTLQAYDIWQYHIKTLELHLPQRIHWELNIFFKYLSFELLGVLNSSNGDDGNSLLLLIEYIAVNCQQVLTCVVLLQALYRHSVVELL